MTDEAKPPEVQTSAPPVSPTGQPVIPQTLTRIALLVFGVAGGIAAAAAAGIDVSFLPPVVPKACALIAFIAGYIGLAGPGVRLGQKMVPVVLLFLSLGLSNCAHPPPPIVITARSMTALNDTFTGTAAAMEAAYDAHDITPEQYRKWADFGRRFQACSAIAENLYDAAAYAKDDSVRSHAEAILTDFEAELSQYAALALQVVHPDGGP